MNTEWLWSGCGVRAERVRTFALIVSRGLSCIRDLSSPNTRARCGRNWPCEGANARGTSAGAGAGAGTGAANDVSASSASATDTDAQVRRSEGDML